MKYKVAITAKKNIYFVMSMERKCLTCTNNCSNSGGASFLLKTTLLFCKACEFLINSGLSKENIYFSADMARCFFCRQSKCPFLFDRSPLPLASLNPSSRDEPLLSATPLTGNSFFNGSSTPFQLYVLQIELPHIEFHVL